MFLATTWAVRWGGREVLAGSHGREQEEQVPLCEPLSLAAFRLVQGDGAAPREEKPSSVPVLPATPQPSLQKRVT